MARTRPKAVNAFSSAFGDGSGYVCDGDTISCERAGITYVARIVRDDSGDRPDERDDGFWPSLDPKSAGYIGGKSEATLQRRTARAQAVLEAWARDEWWYVGVVIAAYYETGSAEVGRIELDDHAASLWGIECNYPASRRNPNPNIYLTEVANELLLEAEDRAKQVLAAIIDRAVMHREGPMAS